jgi:hypothetical protein
MSEALEKLDHSRRRELDMNLALLAIGVVQSLRLKKLSIEQSRRVLFNFSALGDIKARRADPRLMEMMAWGMELPNVQRLVPEGLEESYRKIESLAAGIVALKPRAHSGVPRKARPVSKHRVSKPIAAAMDSRLRKAERQVARGLVPSAPKLRRK